MAVPHFGHWVCLQGRPATCGTFSPQLGQTQDPPGPAACGPPTPWRAPPALRHPLPRPPPKPKPLGIANLLDNPHWRRQALAPGIPKAASPNLPVKKAARTSRTGPQTKLTTRIPAEASATSKCTDIAPHISTSGFSATTSVARDQRSVPVKVYSRQARSRPLSTSNRARRAAVSNTGETRPSQLGIATSTRRASARPLPLLGHQYPAGCAPLACNLQWPGRPGLQNAKKPGMLEIGWQPSATPSWTP